MYRRLILLMTILLLPTALERTGGANDDAMEYRLKAAFLYNLARFVEWPGGSQDKNGEAIVIGILGDDPFGPILESTIPREKRRRKATTGQEDRTHRGNGRLSPAFHQPIRKAAPAGNLTACPRPSHSHRG